MQIETPGSWNPQGSPLLVRETGSQEIYGLDLGTMTSFDAIRSEHDGDTSCSTKLSSLEFSAERLA